MDFIRYVMIFFIFFISPVHAEGPVLSVGIQSFVPPFAMQGAGRSTYGYDIDMMNSLCKLMNRSCEYRIMKFNQLLRAVADRKIDAALSTITITADRAKIVSFTLPYLLSHSRFLTNANNTDSLKQNFSLVLLNNRNIGVLSGSVFADQISTMSIQDPHIKLYETIDLLIEGLSKKEVDFILVDNATAIYWSANGTFMPIGPPFLFGFGIGIAVNKANTDLLEDLNKALLQYQASKEYTLNYNRYLKEF